MLEERRLRVATKVYRGDFQLQILSPDEETFSKAAMLWRGQASNGWRRFTKRMKDFTETDVYVICLESVGNEFAANLHKRLSSNECYMGAVQVDDSAEIHWNLYSDS